MFADSDGCVALGAWEGAATLLHAQAGRALDAAPENLFPRVLLKGVLVDLQEKTGGAVKLMATGSTSLEVKRTALSGLCVYGCISNRVWICYSIIWDSEGARAYHCNLLLL